MHLKRVHSIEKGGLLPMNDKKIGLGSVIATGVGLVVASSCLLTLGIGAGSIGTPFIITMIIACCVNIFTLLSIAELNSMMPDLTGGLAQFSLACVGPFITIICMVGGYLLCTRLRDPLKELFSEILLRRCSRDWDFRHGCSRWCL